MITQAALARKGLMSLSSLKNKPRVLIGESAKKEKLSAPLKNSSESTEPTKNSKTIDDFIAKNGIVKAYIAGSEGEPKDVSPKEAIPDEATDLEFHRTFFYGYTDEEYISFKLPTGETKKINVYTATLVDNLGR